MIEGIPVCGGIAVGPAWLYRPVVPEFAGERIDPGEVEGETGRFLAAREQAVAQLEALRARDPEGERAHILTAHADMVMDEAVEEDVAAAIEDDLLSAGCAVERVYAKYAALLEQAADPRMRERRDDLIDVQQRLLRILAGVEEAGLAGIDRPVVLVAEDLLPSQTAALDPALVLGIVTERGGATSHAAIIAKSYGIPALLGARGALEAVRPGGTVVLDTLEGVLLCDPTPAQEQEYRDRRERWLDNGRRAAAFRAKPCATRDGVGVEVLLNLGGELPEDTAWADGVGLLRSEFLYLEQSAFPGEEEQYQAYRRVLEAFPNKPVTLRTLDIGGDKTLSYWPLPREENPFLGNRGLRLCLSHPDIFRTQLRAALRASVHGELWLMFPMVSGLEELRAGRALAAAATRELEGEGVSPRYKLGVMVETPASALLAPELAREVDFASVGTNDLCQYLTASDRLNEAVSGYYQSFHPAMMRALAHIAHCFAQAGKPVSICGELAGDALAAPALVGMGYRKLSMSATAAGPVKMAVAALELDRARALAQAVCGCATQAEVLALLKQHNPQ